MRVCMLAYTFYESDNRVMRYAEALAGRGDEVDVIALRRPDQARRDCIHGVRIFRIQERVKTERAQLTYLLRVVEFFFRSAFWLAWRHVRRPYSVIHVHSVPDFLVFAAWLPRLLGARLVLDLHDLSPELYAAKFGQEKQSFASRVLIAVERASCAFANRVILPNHLWLDKVVARSTTQDKCSVFLNLPDRAIFEPRTDIRSEEHICRLLYPGSLQWHQGLDIAIRAFAKAVTGSGIQAEFHIYGEGQAKESLIELAQQIGVGDKIVFHSAAPLRDIAMLMRTADLGIIAKRNSGFGNEAFSTKILEFMAVGVPVIAAETKIDRYYFFDDVISFFANGSVDELADCIVRLIRSPATRCRQAAAARHFVSEKFNWDKSKHEYLCLIDSLAEPGKVREAQPANS